MLGLPDVLEVAVVPDDFGGNVVEVHVISDQRLVQEVPEEQLGACAIWSSLTDHDDQLTPSHRVQLEEIEDVLPVLDEDLVVRASLHDGPIVRTDFEDLGPEIPLEVLVTRMADLLEDRDAREGDIFHAVVRSSWFSSWIHTA